MNDFINVLLSLSLSGTLLLLFVFLLKQLYKNKFSKCWQYYIWLVVALRFLFPFAPNTTIIGHLFEAAEPVSIKENTESENISNVVKEEPAEAENEQLGINAEITVSDNAIDIDTYLFFVWSAAALVFMIRKMTMYQSFIHYVRAGNTAVSDIATLNLLADCEDKLKIRKTLELYRNPLIASPVMIGLIRPCIIIPDMQAAKEEQTCIFMHELIHYKRKDIIYKWFIQIVTCVHWFNPFICLLEKEINRACELSCDEAVISSLDDDAKKSYGDTLLSFPKRNNAYKGSLASLTLTEGAEQLKERLGAIMNFKKKSKTITVITAIMTIGICI